MSMRDRDEWVGAVAVRLFQVVETVPNHEDYAWSELSEARRQNYRDSAADLIGPLLDEIDRLRAAVPAGRGQATPSALTVFLGFDDAPRSTDGRLLFDHGTTINATVTFEVRNGTAVYIVRPVPRRGPPMPEADSRPRSVQVGRRARMPVRCSRRGQRGSARERRSASPQDV